jgi:hypothetical protein
MADALLDGYRRLPNPIGRISEILLGLIMAATLLFLGGVALGRYAGYTRPAQTGSVTALMGAVLIAAVKALGRRRGAGDARE